MIILFEKLLSRLFESMESREREARESYLADAVDLVDLEFRMKKLDSGTYPRHWLAQ